MTPHPTPNAHFWGKGGVRRRRKPFENVDFHADEPSFGATSATTTTTTTTPGEGGSRVAEDPRLLSTPDPPLHPPTQTPPFPPPPPARRVGKWSMLMCPPARPVEK